MTVSPAYLDALRDLRHLDARAATDLADYLVALENENKADRTINAYRLELARLLRANMEKAVGDFTAADVNLWIADHPRKSRHIARSIAAGWFKWLEWQERIVKNPMDKVGKVKAPPRPLLDVFSEGERSALMGLEAPHGELFSVLFGSGIRRDEAIRLTWGDVDLNRERIHVRHGKGDKPRAVPLLDFAVLALADLGLLGKGHVFDQVRGPGYRRNYRAKHRPGEPVSTSAFQRWYADCIHAAGVSYRKPHTTRHTYNEILRHLGYSAEERQLLLGHASVRTTIDVYGHISIEDVARKMRAEQH